MLKEMETFNYISRSNKSYKKMLILLSLSLSHQQKIADDNKSFILSNQFTPQN